MVKPSQTAKRNKKGQASRIGSTAWNGVAKWKEKAFLNA